MMLTREEWNGRLRDEVGFWDLWFHTKGYFWPEDYRARLDPLTPLPARLVELLAPTYGNVSAPLVDILDVGAGPLTNVGQWHPTWRVRVTPIDPLAKEYMHLRLAYGVTAPIPTQWCAGEDIGKHFPADTFDCVYACNSLDHAFDPLRIINEMVRVAKPGALIYLLHKVREADVEHRVGLHQWNFYPEAGRFYIEPADGTRRIDVSAHLRLRATVAVYPIEAGVRFEVVMRKFEPNVYGDEP